jgi:glycosyltransferase involved in cell wall biosynthesis
VNVGVSRHVGQRIALPRTEIIWNGTPTPAPNGGPARNEHPACFAYLGRLVAEKGVPVLFRASRQLAIEGYDFRLKIVGDGPERERLERLANHLDIATRTEFTGSISQTALPSMLKDTMAVVMPSTWEDVCPLVAIEQMMQSRLLIVSDIGGMGEMVNGVGFTFPPGDANALAACMREALDNPALSADLAMKGQARALEKFTQDRMVAEHLHLYKELMHS